MSNQAFLLDDGLPASAAPGDAVVIDGPEGHHAVTVKRVRPGEQIDVLSGTGTRAVCTVRETAKASLTAIIDRIEREDEPPVELVLVQALAKGDRDLQAVEAAVELGIDAIQPWQSDRSVVRWAAAKADKGRAKWAATVRAAVKQSRRTRLPEVASVMTTQQLAARLAQPKTQDGPEVAIILHESATEPLSAVVRNFMDEVAAGDPAAGRPRILLLVGPEGGIADAEISRLTEAGAQTAVLGRHVLRASTAGPAALVITRHIAGVLDR
ncbi:MULTISPECIES: 16S rRNA (uracil(1498)-N(3))-methyltransferase [Micrococcaceae]|uniref:Ribosomal RNA small subunit methyltransferase E n=1 Tax=Arthrobacter rhombi TaxID=71253 RepID=A0A1R4GV05_9MICC|nr:MULTISPECIES: 16S rRNA (uracil(1498)-N(3))-methyltransferase [Micrococcaceae]PCC26664.1 16S rRNA (uracil(1498)-N(3))-methyltransferase [Glutamicibacter sp. BW78]SJM72008.1 Ribosomal RNA small subunit methyltransferase E [Arthrobacter rhombi]